LTLVSNLPMINPMEKKTNSRTRLMSLTGLMTGITIVFTLIVRIPVAPTRGYITLADVAVYFSAFAFGPVIGGLTAGLGTGLADLIGGYPQWMVLSFLIHGLQGLTAGFIGRRGKLGFLILGMLVGGVIMVAGYFTAGALLYGTGPALAELPGNSVQVLVGGLAGIPLVYAVRKAYPPLIDMTKPRSWEEE
jgi:uncharacterized membrane protein